MILDDELGFKPYDEFWGRGWLAWLFWLSLLVGDFNRFNSFRSLALEKSTEKLR